MEKPPKIFFFESEEGGEGGRWKAVLHFQIWPTRKKKGWSWRLMYSLFAVMQVAIEAVFECLLRWGTGGLVTANGPLPRSGSSWKVRPNSFIRRNHLPRGRPQSLSRPTLLLRVPLTSGTPSISIFILFLFITKGVFLRVELQKSALYLCESVAMFCYVFG